MIPPVESYLRAYGIPDGFTSAGAHANICWNADDTYNKRNNAVSLLNDTQNVAKSPDRLLIASPAVAQPTRSLPYSRRQDISNSTVAATYKH